MTEAVYHIETSPLICRANQWTGFIYDNGFRHERVKRDKPFTIRQKNIQSLAIELFKVKGNISNNIMYDIFQTREINYNLRSQTDFASNCLTCNKFGQNSLRYFASKVGSMVPL